MKLDIPIRSRGKKKCYGCGCQSKNSLRQVRTSEIRRSFALLRRRIQTRVATLNCQQGRDAFWGTGSVRDGQGLAACSWSEACLDIIGQYSSLQLNLCVMRCTSVRHRRSGYPTFGRAPSRPPGLPPVWPELQACLSSPGFGTLYHICTQIYFTWVCIYHSTPSLSCALALEIWWLGRGS